MVLPQAQRSSLTVKILLSDQLHITAAGEPARSERRIAARCTCESETWDAASPLWLSATTVQMTDAPHTDNKQLNTLACARLCAVWILMRKDQKAQRQSSQIVSHGVRTGDCYSSWPQCFEPHRSDQGHCATDVCPGALFQAWVLLAHTPKEKKGGAARNTTDQKTRRKPEEEGVQERNRGSKEEKMDGTREKKTEGKRKTGRRCVSALGSRTSGHAETRSTLSCFCQTATRVTLQV